MAPLHKVLLFLTFLFLVVDAKDKKNKDKSTKFFHMIPGIPKFPMFFPTTGADQSAIMDENVKPDFETNSLGRWELINKDSGVSAMQINLMPNNKIIVYDATVYRVSRLTYPEGMPCVPFFDATLKQEKQDCFAHSMEYDIETNQVRPLTVKTDPWCSCGGLTPDGTLVVAGGFADGGKTSRYYGGQANCEDCDWREFPNKFQEDRWYATQAILPNGEYIVIGGRRSFSYEFFPKEGQASFKPYFFPFLYETSDIDENNLYPFVHLSTDGNLFIFANNRSLLLNPNTNKVVRTYPVLPGGSRNYPASGMSSILPIKLDGTEQNSASIKVEVIVCGGNSYDSFYLAETKKFFLPALKDCSRMIITDPNPQWDTEEMPSGRTMGDSLILPNGQILFINGAQKGTAAWWDADEPNFTPVLYWPEKPKGERFKVLKATKIARMYHSTSAVLPSGKIWVGGSNTHDTYKDKDKFPTETRVESFSPPYLDKNLDKYRPKIVEESLEKKLRYGNNFETQFKMQNMDQKLTKQDIKVTMYFPPFTTHGYSMNQRLLVLNSFIVQNSEGIYKVMSKAPSFREVAPPGYYLLFIVHRGVPSKGMWVHID
ncbi:Galactose oxidase [Spatholobus suberectus]|nr:Galactose oxidase [Spatholobus suberectus]